MNDPAAAELERVTRSGEQTSPSEIRKLFGAARVIAFGMSSQIDPTSGESLGTQLLHLRLEGEEYLPVFTSVVNMSTALRLKPEWGDKIPLEIDGSELLLHLGRNVVIAINPGGSGQYYLPVV